MNGNAVSFMTARQAVRDANTVRRELSLLPSVRDSRNGAPDGWAAVRACVMSPARSAGLVGLCVCWMTGGNGSRTLRMFIYSDVALFFA